ncbi:MAG: hypothetical protein AAF823_16175 [Planctomycetota bacterium]
MSQPPGASPVPSQTPCITCGYDLSGTAIGGNCPECGTPVRESLRIAGYGQPANGTTDGSPTVCLIFGILSLVTGCGPLGVVAIWQYPYAKRAVAQGRAPQDQMMLATVGVVLGWIGVVLFTLGALFFGFVCGLPMLIAILAP